MKFQELIQLFEKGKKRWHLVGKETAGVVAGLDLEGRLFAVLNGEVLNRVNPDAFLGQSNKEEYLNPGGDGFWPAPEGTCFGYQYGTGTWRVPPGISGARYRVTQSEKNKATIQAEIDLINAQGLGLPTAFERCIRVTAEENGLVITTTERIEYLGSRSLNQEEALLAPWTLAQFDSGPGCEAIFPIVDVSSIWDLYEPSDQQRSLQGQFWHTKTDGSQRYQIGLDEQVDWIEYLDPGKGLRVRRTAEKLPPELSYIDIADKPPEEKPSAKGIRYSVYSDPSLFMELEVAGGCPEKIVPGQVLELTVTTRCTKEQPNRRLNNEGQVI